MIENDVYKGTPDTVLNILRAAYGPHGAKSWTVRKFAEDTIKAVRPRSYLSEALAIYYRVCRPDFRYTHDPEKIELVKSPERMIAEIQQRGVALGDCDDLTTVLVALESVIGVPCRIGTGAFDIRPDLWPKLSGERPEQYGFRALGGPMLGGPFTHVWPEIQRKDGVWVLVDPVAGPDSAQMRRRLKQVRYYGVR